MKDTRFHISFAVQICFISICMIAATATFFGYQSYKSEAARKAAGLAQEILSIVKTAAIRFNLELHEEIYYDMEDGLQGQAEFSRIREVLTAIRDTNDLLHGRGSPVYTLRKSYDFDSTGELEFVVMSDPNESGDFYTGARLPAEEFQVKVLDGKSQVTSI